MGWAELELVIVELAMDGWLVGPWWGNLRVWLLTNFDF